jgi:peptidoglycan/LPS O-acetylase OafA/YrhL
MHATVKTHTSSGHVNAEIKTPVRIARIAGLDGMRGIAVALVMGCHASIPFMVGGSIGVDIFFVLSGFLISRILITEFEKTGRIDFIAFYWRRFLRIVPPLLAVCLGWLCVAPILSIPLPDLAKDFSVTLTFIADYTRAKAAIPSYLAPTWSVAVEEQFYLFWPAIALGLMTLVRSKDRIVVALLATALAVDLWRYHRFVSGDNLMAIYDSFDARFDALCFGCAIAFLDDRNLGRVGWFWPAAAVFLTGTVYASWNTQSWLYLGGFSLVGAAAAVMIAAGVSQSSTALSFVLDSGPLRWLGKISYSLYLWHWPPVIFLATKGHSGNIMLVSIPFGILMATLSERFIERPAAKLKSLESQPVRIFVSLIVPALFAIGIIFVLPNVHR